MKKSIFNSRINLVMMVYNEEDVIEKVIRENFAYIAKFPHGKLIVTEDGSTDNTCHILKNLQKKLKFILHSSPKRKGAARAQRDALAIAKKDADIVLLTDSDGQHDPNDFNNLLGKIDSFDMVIGRKYPRHDPKLRVIGSRVWNWYLKNLFGVKNLSDINCGFRAIKVKILDDLLKKNESFPECGTSELSVRAHQKGYKQTQVNIRHLWRKSEPKAWNPKKIPLIAWGLFNATLRLKKEFNFSRPQIHQDSMINKYEDLYSDFKKCRGYWEGEMWDYYKLPKYLSIIKSFLSGPIEAAKPTKILELGSGDGEIALAIFGLFGREIKHITLSEIIQSACKTLKKIIAAKKLTKYFSVAKIDAQDIKFPNNSFDIVCTIDTMHHVPDPYKMAREMLRTSSRYVFLIESNGLSFPRRLLEQTIKYKISDEYSYSPRQYRDFFLSAGPNDIKSIKIKPFLFSIPKLPKKFKQINNTLSEIIEKIPLLKWQCSGLAILIEKKCR